MNFLRKAPILRIFIPYSLGIVPGLFFGIDFYFKQLWWVILGAGFLFLLNSLLPARNQQKIGKVIPLLLFSLSFFGLGVFQWHQTRFFNQENYFNPEVAKGFVELKITNYIPADTNQTKVRFEAEIVGFADELDVIHSTVGGCMVNLKLNGDTLKKLQTGDRIIISKVPSKIPPKVHPWGFDYPQFLARKNIDFQVFISSNDVLEVYTGTFDLLASIKQLRNKILVNVKPHFTNKENFGVFGALVLGQKASLDDEISGAYANAGTMHVLAVSGLHVGILYFVLSLLFKPLKTRRRFVWVGAIIQILIIWFYAAIAGLSPSIMRAATMFMFLIIGDNLNRNSYIFNTLAISALLLTLSQPELLASVGFQLSYLAVIGIVVMYVPLYNLFHFKNGIINWAWGITCVSIAAQLAVLPLSIFYFNQMPTYFVLANLLVIPMATINLCIGLLTSIFAFVSEILVFLGWLVNHSIAIQNAIVSFISNLPYSYFSGLVIENWHLLFFYSSMICFIGFLITYQKQWLTPFFASLLIIASLSFYFEWKVINTRQIVVFHHPKTKYVAYQNGKEKYVFVKGKRDEFFESFELAAYMNKGFVDSTDVIQKDSLNRHFSFFNNKLLFPQGMIDFASSLNQLSLEISDSILVNEEALPPFQFIRIGNKIVLEKNTIYATAERGPFILDF